MAGNLLKSHFTCFDFPKTFHSGDVVCTLSRFLFSWDLSFLFWQFIALLVIPF